MVNLIWYGAHRVPFYPPGLLFACSQLDRFSQEERARTILRKAFSSL
jgi:hypothetical protein